MKPDRTPPSGDHSDPAQLGLRSQDGVSLEGKIREIEADFRRELLALSPAVAGRPESNRPAALPSEPAKDTDADALTSDPEFTLRPVDLERMLSDPLPPHVYLHDPYVPAGSRSWWFGPAESFKSLFALWVTSELTAADHRVVFVSAENPLNEDLRRCQRMGPNATRLRFFNESDLDLTQASHREALFVEARAADLVILDSFSSVWAGNDNDNVEVAAFDRDTLTPLRSWGVAVIVVDHTGHPQPNGPRRGVSVGRGASTKGQKADVVLEFRPQRENRFSIVHAKNRYGPKQPEQQFEAIDQDDGRLTIIEATGRPEGAVAERAADVVAAIRREGPLTTKRVKDMTGRMHSEVEALFHSEHPKRVEVVAGKVATKGGRQNAKLFRLVDEP